MELRAGYKKTEVGLIPEDWVVKTIGEISNPVRGGSPRPAGDPKYFNGNFIPWLTVAALTNIPISQISVTETETSLTQEGSLHSRVLDKETVIVANSGATLGVAKILGIKCCANDGIAALIDFDKEVSKEFLIYFINTKIKYLREVVATGNGQPNLNTGLISIFKLPLPPTKAEQTAIATALSDTDALITSLEKLILKKRNIRQGAMQKLLRPKEGWMKKELGCVLKVKHGKSQKEVEDPSGGYPILGTGGLMGFANSYLYNKPSVLIGRKGTIDKPQFMETPFWTVDTLFYTEIFDEYSPKYLFYVFLQIDWYSFNEASGVPSLSAKTIEKIEMLFPLYDEQIQVVSILSDMDAEIEGLEAKLEKYKKLKLGMMQNLLTGKIRLI